MLSRIIEWSARAEYALHTLPLGRPDRERLVTHAPLLERSPKVVAGQLRPVQSVRLAVHGSTEVAVEATPVRSPGQEVSSWMFGHQPIVRYMSLGLPGDSDTPPLTSCAARTSASPRPRQG